MTTGQDRAPRVWPAIGRAGVFWAGYLAILFLASIPRAMAPPRWSALVWGVMSSIAILALTLLLLKRDGRVLSDIGLYAGAASAGRFVAGLAIGLSVYGLVIVSTSQLIAPIHFTRLATPDGETILLILGSYLALSMMEELGFRGYPLRTLGAAMGPWRALAVVTGAFCLSHIAFGWPWVTVALGVLPSAVLFGVAALAARDLAMPIGIHAAMNIARWMAGQTETAGIWTMSIDEPGRWAGVAFTSLVGSIVPVLCAGALWWSSRIRGAPRSVGS